MIEIINGPLVSQPLIWNLVFERKATCWWLRPLGKYKHVRAYGYVPFLHIWQFVDVGLRGFNVFAAADGPAANGVIGTWIATGDVIQIKPRRDGVKRLPLLGFCVPAIKHLVGMHTSSLRPDAFFRDCLRHGGILFDEGEKNADHTKRVAASSVS